MSEHPVHRLIDEAIARAHAADSDLPPLIGVGGAQGSGKTTLCRVYAEAHPRVAHFSLDDVCKTKAEREAMASALNPLCVTRGPPGTHDLDLADGVILALEDGEDTALPRFDKATDDRTPRDAWPLFIGQPEAILVDGWCMGALRESGASRAQPINALEAEEDADGVWRRLIENALVTDYASFFSQFDAIIYLQAPSFEIVRRWRGQQEEEMLGRAMTAEESFKLDRFIQHYERVTRSMLAGNLRADWIVRLDENRNVVSIEER
ncbi:MAG: kinase [Alphaproteobacteria bacterium]